MNWIDEVHIRLQRNNQILFIKNSTFLQDLALLFPSQDRRVMVLWAFDLAAESIAKLEEKYPHEKRPRDALDAARDWSAGNIKMRLAQQKILACHAFAKEIKHKEDIAQCHAIGQACAVVHTAEHALGYPIYDLTSIVYEFGLENGSQRVEARKQQYIEKLFYWNEHFHEYTGKWAGFLLK